MDANDLKIEVLVKQGPEGKYCEIEYKKPLGMSTQEVCGWLDQAKLELQLKTMVSD